jgi:glycosyltransferase involved in cell wall biosynthesis
VDYRRGEPGAHYQGEGDARKVISVVILTLNEQAVLPGCLSSLCWCDDILVFDSFSSDSTPAVARHAGARVIQRSFTDYADQRNAALQQGDFKHPWVLMIDADERVSPELVAEMQAVVAVAMESVTMYRMRRKDMLMGRWLKRSSGYPTWFGRLMRPGRVRIERAINEEYHTDGAVKYLQEHLIHFPFAKGFNYWIERHNRYSSSEAEALRTEKAGSVSLTQLFSRDPARRRKSLKQVVYRLPARPFLIFIYLYLIRLGFLDGRAGLTFCRLRMTYEYMIDLKMGEIRRRQHGLPL